MRHVDRSSGCPHSEYCRVSPLGSSRSMCEPGVPELAHDLQALIDDGVVDVGVTDLHGPVEEFRDQEVLAFGCHLDDPVRRRGGVATDKVPGFG